jgi:hypothetical protein
VHPVVDEPGVTLGRLASTGRIQIGLVGDRVLEVGEVVAFGREQLQEGDPEIGRTALGPRRVALGCEIDVQLPEAGVVAGEVVQRRLDECAGRAVVVGCAIEVDRATRPDVDRSDREEAIQPRERSVRDGME